VNLTTGECLVLDSNGKSGFTEIMIVPLEDTFADIIGKAQRGLGLSESVLAERARFSVDKWRALRGGEFDADALAKAAPVLGLNAKALIGLPSYTPGVEAVPGLVCFATPWDNMMVNAYILWDTATKEAVAFDTGADCDPMLAFLKDHGLHLRSVFVTHTHGDHIIDIDRLCEKTGAAAYVSEIEPLEGATTFAPGREFACGVLRIATRLTCGHSVGGTTYYVTGLAQPVAVVGDALFAGSMGGGMVSYADALRTNRAEIFSLPPETILCPGHGPLTTVGLEQLHNPFFA
jgi:hydroxyacylglutathione hydrolase